MARQTLAQQGAADRRKRDIASRTPQTARQRSVVAKRKIGSQVSSASQGITKSKRPALDQNMQTLKSIGETLIKLATQPVTRASENLEDAAKAVTALVKPKPKAKESKPSSASRRSAATRPTPATAKPTGSATPKHEKNPGPRYRG